MMPFSSAPVPPVAAICPICPADRKGMRRFLSASNGWPRVLYRHVTSTPEKVLVLGGGNTAMDCCRMARRLGGEDVQVIVRSPRADMKASPWEIEDAEEEGIPIIDNHSPVDFVIEDGNLVGMNFQKMSRRLRRRRQA